MVCFSPSCYFTSGIIGTWAGLLDEPIGYHDKTPFVPPTYFHCGGGSLFEPEEIRDDVNCPRRESIFQGLHLPSFFRFGIQYHPPPSERGTRKMITITNLPDDITVTALLSKVRGGRIVSCQLLQTCPILGSPSALIRFVDGEEAEAYAAFTSKHPIHFGGRHADIKLVQSPSWPLPIGLETAIFQYGHSRCLQVKNYPREVSKATLLNDLRYHRGCKETGIEFVKLRKNRVLELRFNAISLASKAQRLLNSWYTYRQCQVSYVADPCEFPLETMIDDQLSSQQTENLPVDEEKKGVQEAEKGPEHRICGDVEETRT
jgi:hypothetical protein